MNIDAKKLADLPAVYVTAELMLGGKRYFAAASENPGEHAYIFDPETGEKAELWTGDTGCMNIIQIPNTEKLLCITKFYPVFKSKDAEVSILEPTEKGYMSPWKKTVVFHLPYVHRIGCFTSKGKNYVIACALCKDKDFVEDWSKPGAVYVAPIEDKNKWSLTMQVNGLLKNHGLFISGDSDVYVTSENGIMYFDFSAYEEGNIVKPALISGFPTSDISIDAEKLAAIEPFHGNKVRVYDKKMNILKEYDITFGHVVWVGTILGDECLIIGERGDKKELTVHNLRTNEKTILGEGVGPTQISVISEENKAIVLSANHGAGTVDLYTLTK